MNRRNKIVQEITRNVANVFSFYAIILIEHDFQCINIRQVPWEVLKTEVEDTLANANPRTELQFQKNLLYLTEALKDKFD